MCPIFFPDLLPNSFTLWDDAPQTAENSKPHIETCQIYQNLCNQIHAHRHSLPQFFSVLLSILSHAGRCGKKGSPARNLNLHSIIKGGLPPSIFQISPNVFFITYPVPSNLTNKKRLLFPQAIFYKPSLKRKSVTWITTLNTYTFAIHIELLIQEIDLTPYFCYTQLYPTQLIIPYYLTREFPRLIIRHLAT